MNLLVFVEIQRYYYFECQLRKKEGDQHIGLHIIEMTYWDPNIKTMYFMCGQNLEIIYDMALLFWWEEISLAEILCSLIAVNSWGDKNYYFYSLCFFYCT